MYSDVTIVILLYNKGHYLERAVKSILLQGEVCEIIVVDDHSTDDSYAIAVELESRTPCLRIIQTSLDTKNMGPANTVSTGIREVKTQFLMSLGADDFYYPGRIESLVSPLRQGADIALGGMTMVEGDTGKKMRTLPIPPFLFEKGGLCWQFERNWLSGLYMATRTSVYEKVPYNGDLPTLEDYDFILRAISAGVTIELVHNDDVAYAVFDNTLSRDLSLMDANFSAVLGQFDQVFIFNLYNSAGLSKISAYWALISMKIFMADYEAAIGLLNQLDELKPAFVRGWIVESNGPFPVDEKWRRTFTRGTLELLLGRDGYQSLMIAYAIDPSPETKNNLAVCFMRQGDVAGARAMLQSSLAESPDYMDARKNLENLFCGNISDFNITKQILRRHVSRSAY